MLIRKIIPVKEKVELDKRFNKGIDFFRVIPFEEFSHDNMEDIIKDIGKYKGHNIILINSQDEGIKEIWEQSALKSLFINNQDEIIKTLLELYGNRKQPKVIIFDYKFQRVNVHSYMREIYIRQNLSAFRNIPVIIYNYPEDNFPLLGKIKVLAVNGSPRKKGDTKRLLEEEINKYWTGPYYESLIIDLEHIEECIACGGHQKNCNRNCIIKDQMTNLLPEVRKSHVLILGSPVYMDLPTARTIAFLSRLTGMTKYNRLEYTGKYAIVLSSGYCSGTKAVISSLTNALEMIGFDIPGRTTKEYIQLWTDGKTRGGVPNDFYWPE